MGGWLERHKCNTGNDIQINPLYLEFWLKSNKYELFYNIDIEIKMLNYVVSVSRNGSMKSHNLLLKRRWILRYF